VLTFSFSICMALFQEDAIYETMGTNTPRIFNFAYTEIYIYTVLLYTKCTD
jgi:hypothetical protein